MKYLSQDHPFQLYLQFFHTLYLKVSETRITYAERINVKVNTKTEQEINAIAQKEKQTVIYNAIAANKATYIGLTTYQGSGTFRGFDVRSQY